MAVVEVSITPLGMGTSVSRYVAGCVKIVRESGLKYQLTPMGTIIEGDIDAIFGILRRMHESPFGEGAVRVSTLVKIDDRRDRDAHTMEGKVQAVQAKL
jgi:uncharacterized protein (TIGR00106 family)